MTRKNIPRNPSRLSLRRTLPLAMAPAFLVLAGCPPDDPAPEPDPELEAWGHWTPVFDAEIVDLTHPFDEETLVWPTSDRFELEEVYVGRTDAGYYYEAYNIFTPEHGGTHMDAPIHFMEERWRAHEVPANQLVGPGVVVHLPDRDEEDPNYQVTVEDLEAWEEEHGVIPESSIVLLAFHRSELWPDAEAYMGTAERGEAAIPDLEFPGLHPEAATWLAEERQVAAVGLDTPSIDHGPSETFEAHQALARRNVVIFENVANLQDVPPTGSLVMALPMKVGGGSGGPLRIVAAVPT